MTCAHCSLPLGHHVVDGRYCCAACANVSRMLHDSGLADTYYRLAEMESGRPLAATAGPSLHALRELDSPSFLAKHTRALQDGALEIDLHLDGVHCAACVWLVERLPREIPGVESARLDLSRARVRLSWRPQTTTLAEVGQWLGRFGYTPGPLSEAGLAAERAEKTLLRHVGLAWAIAANVMILAFTAYAGLTEADRLLFHGARWVSLLLTGASLLVAGRTFFRRAGRSLRRALLEGSFQHLDMDTPIAIGLGVGYVDSLVHTFRGTGEVWFDSLSVLTAALLSARLLQQRAQRMARDRADQLATTIPTRARVEQDDGTVVDVPVDRLRAGDTIRVEPGDLFPADGAIVSGRTSIDRSMISGEPFPEGAGPGDAVLAGTINATAPVRCRVTRVGQDTRIGSLLQLMESGGKAAPITQLAQRLASPFVATVLAIAIGSALFWLWADPSRVIPHTVALLVITCPCALGMASPLAIALASGQAARRGVFIRNEAALDTLGKVDLVVLDKTGTLTEGMPAVVRLMGSPYALELAAAVEAGIQHPVARALREAASRTDLRATHIALLPGKGVSGVVSGKAVRVGAPSWVGREASDPDDLLDRATGLAAEGLSPVAVALDGTVVAVAGLGDRLRPESVRLVDSLRAEGLTLALLSGDHGDVARNVGHVLGLKPGVVEGHLSPEAKQRRIAAWQAAGHCVAMIGDGLNDGPALATADVGIAVDSGIQANRLVADVVLSRGRLAPIAWLRAMSKQTLKIIRLNLGFSLSYNAVAAGLAVAGYITPLAAAIAMPLSSLLVVGSTILWTRDRPGGTQAPAGTSWNRSSPRRRSVPMRGAA